jgi:hypothetical protein
MPKPKPDHEDAELVLRVYEMRREPVLRQAREALRTEFWPKSAEDAVAVTRGDHPLNGAYRQVGTYWEMVYGMVRHGVVNPGFFLESNLEGLFLFAKLEAYVDEMRKATTPLAFRNAEWVAKECPEGKQFFEVLRVRVRKLYEARG